MTARGVPLCIASPFKHTSVAMHVNSLLWLTSATLLEGDVMKQKKEKEKEREREGNHHFLENGDHLGHDRQREDKQASIFLTATSGTHNFHSNQFCECSFGWMETNFEFF